MSIQTRTATRNDLPTLLGFEQGIIVAERPYDSTLKPDPISYYDLAELIAGADSEVAVAVLDGVIVGSGSAQKKPSRHYTQPEFHAHLGFMFVLPEYRGKGVNHLILDHLFSWARRQGLPEIRLTVYPDNEPAVKAYTKAGFAPHILEMRKRIT
ncbi:MAG: GNAT family N-acetyltransferase [Planctomycetota bacterium]